LIVFVPKRRNVGKSKVGLKCLRRGENQWWCIQFQCERWPPVPASTAWSGLWRRLPGSTSSDYNSLILSNNEKELPLRKNQRNGLLIYGYLKMNVLMVIIKGCDW